MKFPIKYFITLSAIVALFSMGAWWLIDHYPNWPKPSFLPLSIAVLYILTFVSHMFTRVSSLNRGKPFVQLITMSMVLRITIYGLFSLLIIIFNPGNPAADLVYFGILYLILTVHEVVDIARNHVGNKGGKPGQ